MAARDATYFDGWYADMVGAPAKDELQGRHLGLPAGTVCNSTVPWQGLLELAASLRLRRGATLLDVACGRGQLGLALTAHLEPQVPGLRLVGIDFSAEALSQAAAEAGRRGQDAQFRRGELTALGLPEAGADAAICVDSIQFADHPAAAYAELRRVLRPGGRLALTTWAAHPDDERVSERLRRVDPAAQLRAAGFVEVEVLERPEWRAVERAMWEEAAALDPGEDPALRSFHGEAVRSLASWDALRRLSATATAP